MAGIQTPIIGLRVWATYIAGAKLDPESNGTLDLLFKNATGYRVGAGFKIAIVSLNLEYQSIKYRQAVIEQLGPFATNSALNGVDLTNNSWIASISFPIGI